MTVTVIVTVMGYNFLHIVVSKLDIYEGIIFFFWLARTEWISSSLPFRFCVGLMCLVEFRQADAEQRNATKSIITKCNGTY